MELQSGFVLAVLVAAVLLVDRIGGAPELARRLFQVALGVVIAFTVVGGTAAFIRMPEFTETSSDFSSDEDAAQRELFEDISNRNSAKSSIHLGAGVVAVVLGIAWLRRLATLSIGIALGGLLLILFGGLTQPTNASSSDIFSLFYSTFLGAAIGSAGRAAAIAHFVMLLGGSFALLFFGYAQWDRALPAAHEGEAAV
jgi:hypothetical protein